MICRLCLKNVVCMIKIFTDLGAELKTAKIISKYFWFEPRFDDPISTAICETCWNKLSDFHEFYENVVDAHRLLTERFSLSTVAKPKLSSVPINENAVTTTALTETNDTTTESESEKVEELQLAKNASSRSSSKSKYDNDDLEDQFTTFLDLDDAEDFAEDKLQEQETSTANIRKSSRLSHAESVSKAALVKKPKESVVKDETPKRRGRPRKKIVSPVVPKYTEVQVKASTENIDKRIAEYLCLRCDVCGDEQETFIELRKHMINAHNIERPYGICCEKRFYRRALLFDHVEKHINPERFKCSECDKNFADKQCLRNHLILKHPPEETKTFACEICEKKFAKMYLLEKHREKHEERKHICKLCEKRFSTIYQLNAHTKFIHNNYGRMCDICAKVIRGRTVFERHVLEHQGIKLPKVQCPKCGSWHKDKYCLQKHIRRHNEEGAIHMCTDCGKVAPNRSALLAHKRYVHKAKRNYECGVCKKSFKKQINLKEHMTMHTGETLYNCPHCSRTFNSKANMYSHRKKMHSKEISDGRVPDTETSTNTANENCSLNVTEQIKPISQKDEVILNDDNETHILVLTDNRGELVFEVT